MKSVGPAIAVDVTVDCDEWRHACPSIEVRAEEVIQAVMQATPLPAVISEKPIEQLELSVQFVDDEAVQKLNHEYRGQDKPTNVLSFAQLDAGFLLVPGAPVLLGDVVLAFETCASEADAQEKRFVDHVSHLVCHGALHLLGYDHIDDEDARNMMRIERQVMAQFGLPDPYSED